MSQQYMGEIRIMGFNFPPKHWAQCNGQLMAISQNQALFSLLGTTYGGNGVTTFALPDLRTLALGGVSSSYPLGAITGEYAHTLLQTEQPQHGGGGQQFRADGQQRQRRHRSGLQHVQHRGDAHRAHGAPGPWDGGRQPAARKPPAVPDGEHLHRPGGDLPVAELGRPDFVAWRQLNSA